MRLTQDTPCFGRELAGNVLWISQRVPEVSK